MSTSPFSSHPLKQDPAMPQGLSRRAFLERIAAVSLSSGAAVALLSACGETTSNTPSVDGNATLKIVADKNDNWQNAQKYNKEYPNLKVNLVTSSWGNGGKDMREKELVMMSGGDFPDIAQMVWLKEFARAGLLVDLTDEVKKWDIYKSLSTGQLERMTYNGRIYGITMGNNTIFQYYNKDILARVGVTGPIQTLSDLEALSKKIAAASLKTKDGKTIYTTAFDGGSWATDYWLWAGGGQQMNEDYTKTLIDSPASIQAYSFMQNLIKSGSAPKPDGSATQLWLNGQIAVYFSGSWDAQASIEAKLNYGSAPTPKGPSGLNTTSVGGVEYAIFKNSKHRTEALSLLKTIASNTFQQSADGINAIINLSSYEDAAKQAIWKKAGTLEAQLVNRAQLNNTRYNFLEAPFIFADAATIYNDALQQMLVKLSDPATVMKDAATQINQGITDAANK